MGFIMDGLDAEAYDRTYKDRQLIKRIISYFRPQMGIMVIVAVVLGFKSFVGTAVSLLIRQGIDGLGGGKKLHTAGVVVLIFFVKGALSWTVLFFSHKFI